MYLNKTTEELQVAKAFHTAKEICQQAAMWQKISELLEQLDTVFLKDIAQIVQNKEAQIILSGAGTSAYIGNILALSLNNLCAAQVVSIPTTDIVSRPNGYFNNKSQGVVISFGRSGSSPESIDAVEKIEQLAPQMSHIYITCNPNGGLAQRATNNDKTHLCLMPAATHDESFVMTSSFTTMLLFTYGLFYKILQKDFDFSYEALAQQSTDITENFYNHELFSRLASIERVVYLGSNNLFGAAQEAALKAVEMTTGDIITMAETSLGFRHGPKSIINNKTMIGVFVSNDSYSQLFDKDLINELISEDDAALIVVFANQEFFEHHIFKSDKLIKIALNNALKGYDDALMAALFVNYAQIIGFDMALNLGFSPDDPCPTGQVNRVVQGVSLYNYPNGSKK
ncbi:MAG: SIS domain-containing protein [Alphaproteobacteria bacterium]